MTTMYVNPLIELYNILINSNNYNTYNIDNNTIYKYTIVFTSILLLYILLSYQLYYNNKKRLAWMISLLNSSLLSIIGIVYMIMKSNSIINIINNYNNTSYGRLLYHDIDNVSVLVCLWFAIANILDLVFGYFFYYKEQGVITSYLHHTIFIWIMYTCTTGNGLFIKCSTFSPAFLFMCIEEIPTFLLALGSVFPSCRTDLGFGVSFFLLRIVYHTIFFIYSIYVRTETIVSFLYLLTLMMHINWFSSWVNKYGKKLMSKKK